MYSVRSRKVYSDLVDERAFLEDIKEFWVEKLKDLKVCNFEQEFNEGNSPLNI